FVDNDSSNPDDRQAGYVKLQVLDLSPRSLDVYGTTIRIKRSLADGTLEFDDADCEATTLSAANLGPDTVCPNGHTFQTNQASGTTTWNDWMRGTFTGDIARGRKRTSTEGNPCRTSPGPSHGYVARIWTGGSGGGGGICRSGIGVPANRRRAARPSSRAV